MYLWISRFVIMALIVGTERRRVTLTDGSQVVENSNLLLETYRGAVGIEIGFTDSAGGMAVVARRHRRSLVVVAMRSRNAAVDSKALPDYGQPVDLLEHALWVASLTGVSY